MPDDGSKNDVDPAEPLAGTFGQQTIGEILDVEKRRVDRDNRRTALLEKSLELADEQDRRQFEFATKAREEEMALKRDQSVFFRRLVWRLLALCGLFSTALFILVFFGTEEQQATASLIATPALIAIAGYGVITTLSKAMKSIVDR